MRRYLEALGALGLLVGCSGDGGDDDGLPGERYEFQGAIHTVVVTAASGSVSLTAKTGVVAAEFTPGVEGDTFQFDDDQGRLVLGAVCENGSGGCGTSIEVELPPGTDFEVTTESGPVSLSGMAVVGSIDTNSGPVIGTGLGPMILDIITLTGNQTVQFIEVPTSVSMNGGSGGDLSLTVPAGDYQLETSAGGSTTTQGVQDGPTGPDLDLTTGGDITVSGV